MLLLFVECGMPQLAVPGHVYTCPLRGWHRTGSLLFCGFFVVSTHHTGCLQSMGSFAEGHPILAFSRVAY